MKRLLCTVIFLGLMLSPLMAHNVSVKVFEEVPTIVVDVKENNFDIKVMYAFVKLYQEYENFDLGQIVIRLQDKDDQNIKVLVRKSDLEKLVNRDVDYTKFIKEYAKFI
jgi:hypothetical protein